MGHERSTRICKLSVGADGICRLHYEAHAEISLEDAQEVLAAYHAIRQDKKLPLLVDTKSIESFAREARQYFASDEISADATAAAILVGTPVSQVLGNFYLGLTNPRLPSRLFTSEDEALTWLKGFVE